MDNHPLVSIITIVYNGEKHIAETIRSVAAQTYPNIEYLIIDGGSTDGTLSVIEQFRGHVNSLVSEKDEGISDAFNKGIRRASGEIVGIINADDWYEPDAVELVVTLMGNSDIVYGDLRLWRSDGVDDIRKGDHTRLCKEMTVNHPTVFIRRECYERFGLFDKQYRCAMDYDLLLRLYTAGCRFYYLPRVLANMRWGGMSDAQWKIGCRETLLIKDKYLPDRKLQNWLYYFKHVLAIRASKFSRRASRTKS